MNCDVYQLKISKLLDHELGETESAILFVHMGSCTECQDFFRTSLRIEPALAMLTVPEPSGLHRVAEPATKARTPVHPPRPLNQEFREARMPLSVPAAAMIMMISATIAADILVWHSMRGA